MARKGTVGVSNLLRNSKLLVALRIAVGVVFIIASLDKVDHPEEFYQTIMRYKIVSWSVALVMAMWLPWIELGVGAVLLVGVWPRAIALLFSALTFLFMAAIASALVRGIKLDCGCFGVSDQDAVRTWPTLWQEGVLLLGCLWLWWAHWPRPEQTASGNSA